MMTQIFLRVLSVYLAIAIFNMITVKRAFDEVYGHKPLNWQRFKMLLKRVTCLPLKLFLMDWWFGLWHFDFMVDCVRSAKEAQDRARARA